MSVLEPIRRGPLAALNPVAKLGAALIVTAVLIVSIDPVSAAVALGLELVLLCFAGIPARTLLPRLAPILVAAPLAALTTALYGRSSGTVYLHWWAVEVSDGSLQLGLATMLRILAIGLPAVLLFVTIDPTDLADGLAQILRLPARFVLGGLAGLRLVGLFVDDWRALTLARRARGVLAAVRGDGWGAAPCAALGAVFPVGSRIARGRGTSPRLAVPRRKPQPRGSRLNSTRDQPASSSCCPSSCSIPLISRLRRLSSPSPKLQASSHSR